MKQPSKIALFVSSRRKYALTRITCGVVVGYIGMLGADRAFAAGPIPATTLPGGGSVVAGSATLNVNGSVLNINQTTDRAIVNWDTFSLGSGASVNFNQPSVTSSTLNRVISSNPSEIYGSITSKGSVFFINPNGILFGQGSSVNAPAAVASTLNMRDADFMAGNTSFSGNSQATITNLGRFNVTRGGSVVFIGNNISNVGSISAPGGTVGLVAGDTVSVNIGTPGATQPFTVNGGTAISRQISNSGTITAEGGTVHLQAAALDAAATSGQYADVMHSGAITAGGGTVRLLGQRAGLLAGSTIDTSSDAGGGTVLIGGNYLGKGPEQNAEAVYMDAAASIKANAITNGNGGKVILWSDKYTEANGTIEARGGALGGNGGFIETSSHEVLNANATVNTLAPKGMAGTWLLDPNDITITTANSNISAGPNFTPTGGGSTASTVANSTIVAALATSNVTVSTVSAGTGLGNIVVNAPIAYTGSTARSLTLIASRNVNINAGISSTAAPLTLLVNSNTAGASGYINVNGAISTFGGDVTLAGGTAGNGTGFAVGNGELTNQGNVQNSPGIYFGTSGSIAAGGGNITLRGQGGSGNLGYATGIETGRNQTANTPITTTGAGNITLVGVGGAGSTSSLGVDMRQSTITAGTGAISITGTSPTAVNGTIDNMGVFLVNETISSAGAITINGTGGTSTGSNSAGFRTIGTVSISSSGGAINLTGTAGANGAALGVWLQSGFSVTGTGTASVSITGTAGTVAANDINGVRLETGTVSTVNGALSVTGTLPAGGGTGANHRAVEILTGAAVKSTGTGSVTILGDASASTGTGQGQQGVHNNGVISAAGGAITITGLGGSVGSSFNNGIQLDATGGGTNGSVTGTGTSTITLIGTANKASAATFDAGVQMSGSVAVTTANGAISITGTSASTTTEGLSAGISVQAGSTITAGGNNAVTLTADSIDLAGTINAGTGTVTLQNKTANLAVNVGSADVLSGTKSLGLSNAELNQVTAGNLVIGRNDASASGTVNVAAAVTTLAASGDVVLKTGSNITVNNALSIAAGAKNLTLVAATTGTQTAAITANGLALQGTAAYTLTNTGNNAVTLATGTNVGSVSYMDSNALTVGTIGTDVGVTSSGPVSISTNSGDLTVTNAITTSNNGTSAIVLNASAATAAGTSTGGDVLLSAALSAGAGGRTTIYTGAVATSTGVTAAVGSGSGNFRYKSDETTTNYTVALGSGTYAIYRESPTITPTLTGLTKTYDTVAFTGGMTAVSGTVNGDTLAQVVAATTFNGSAQNAVNAGTYVVATAALNGLGYTVNNAGTATLLINPKPITLTGLTALSKTYDKTSTATITGTAAFGSGASNATDNLVYTSDLGSVTAPTVTSGTFTSGGSATVNQATGLAVTYTTSLGGAKGGNYTVVAANSNLTASITPKNVTLSGLTAANKTYDATNTATFSGTAVLTSGATTSTDNKIYTGDTVTVASGPTSATFSQSNVGNALTVTYNASTASLAGNTLGNYTLINGPVGTANITVKNITISGGLTAANKTYDTTNTATISGTPILTSEAVGTGNATDNKFYAVDSIAVSGTITGAFTNASAANGVTVNYNTSGLTLTGTGNTNYALQSASAGMTANINPKQITLTGLTAQNKTYDTTSTATITGTAVFGTAASNATDNQVYASDAASVTAPTVTSGTFLSAGAPTANQATGLAVTYTASMGGAKGGNYVVVPANSNLTATIAQKTVTVSGLTAQSKTYDATNTASFSGTAALTGGATTANDNKFYTADALTLASAPTVATFGQSNVGNSLTVTYSAASASLGNNAANNYKLADASIGTANITVKSITIAGGLTAANKTYDSTNTATISGTAAFASEAAGTGTANDNKIYTTDTVSVVGTFNGTFTNANAANGVAVNYSTTALSLSGTGSSNYALQAGSAGMTANIARKDITLTGLTAQSKTYDTTLTAALSGTAALVGGASNATDNKVYTSDLANLAVSNTATGTFNQKNVGTGIAVTYSGSGLLSGTASGNYNVTASSAGTADITFKTVTVSGLTAQSKTYDATNKATFSGTAALTGGATTANDNKFYTTDALTLASAPTIATFGQSNVGNGLTVTYSAASASLGNNAANNYKLADASIGTANITVKSITIAGGLTAANKTYDSTKTATISGTAVFASETPGTGTSTDNKIYTSDSISVVGPLTGTFASANAANGVTVSYSAAALSLSGTGSSNYALQDGSAGMTANIARKDITLTGLTAQSKTYDGTNTAALVGTATLVSGAANATDNKVYSSDLANLAVSNTASGTFAQSNVGTGIAVTYSGSGLLTGTASGNYNVTASSAGVADITGKPVVLLGLSALSKTYDTSNAAVITGTASLVGGSTTASDYRVLSSDLAGITVTSPTAGNFTQSDAGINLTVTYSNTGILSGGNSANYVVVPALSNLTANINVKPITINGLTAANKTYDSTSSAVISGTGAYTSGAAAAADNKVYSADAANVAVTSPTVGTFVIGTTPTANVGNGISVIYSPTGMLTGTKAGNYVVVPSQSNLTANITAKPITLTGLTAQNKVYNTTSAATITGTGAYATGAASANDNLVYSADAATLTVNSPTSGTFTSAGTPTANVGTGLAVTFNAAGVLGGASAGNYTVVPANSNLTANITAKPITLTGLTAQSKTYDSTKTAALSGTAVFVSGAASDTDNKVYASDAAGLTVSNTAQGTFNQSDVGNGLAVTYAGTGLLSGTGASNYSVQVSSAGTANITPKNITLTGLTAQNKVYNQSNNATLTGTASYTSGAAAGAAGNNDNKVYAVDTSKLATGSPTTGTFNQSNVGTGIAVTFDATGLLTGTAAGNYKVIPAQSALTADITAKPITITGGLTASSKTYDQTTNAVVSGTGTFTTVTQVAGTATDNKVYTGDVVSVLAGPTAGNFTAPDAGTGVTVTYQSGAVTLTGAQASNYKVVDGTAGMTADIARKSLTITGLTAANKTYDSTNVAVVSGGGNLTGGAASASDNKFYTGDVVSVATGPTVGFFSQSDVGSGLTVTYRTTGVALTGAKSGNYTVVEGTSGMTANITPKPITISGLTAASKTYDTTNTATISGTGAYTTGAAAGAAGNADNRVYTVDAANLTVTSPTSGTFGQSNVGAGLAVTYNPAGVLGGSKAGNYTVVPAQSNLTADITKKTLTVTASNASMVYGDIQPTFVVTPTGFAGSETAASTGFTGSATSPGVHAGTYAITPTATALTNYSFSYVPGTLTINKANLTVAIPDYAKLLTESDPSFVVQAGQYSGFKNGDTSTTALSLVAPTVTRVAGELAGSYALTAAGGSASDYNIVVSYSANGSSATKPAGSGGGPICAPGACSAFTIVGADKLLVTFGNSTGVYGTDPTTVTHTVVNGRYLDSINNTIQTLTQTTSGTANNSIKLADSAGNYVTFDTAANAVFNGGVGTYAVDVKAGTFDATNAIGAFNTFVTTAGVYTVTPKAITATVNNATKVYDGTNYSTTAATVSYNTPLVAGDNFGAANVGGTAVNARNVGSYTTTLNGFANTAVTANYTITPVSGTFIITPATLTLGAVTDSRVYNATTSSTGTVTVANLQTGDSLSGVKQVYQSKNVLGTNGSTLAVAAGYTINDGNGGNNYTVVTTTATGTITQATLSLAGLSGVSRVYDSTTNAGLTGTASLSGVLLTDSVNLAGNPTTGSFADKNVGTNKSITASLAGLSLTGTDANNYLLTSTTTATASVTPFQLSIGGLTGSTKTYDANTTIAVSGTGNLLNSFAGDTVAFASTFTPTSGTLNNKNVGSAKSITVNTTGVNLTGADAGNYAIDQGLTTATGTVTQLQVVLGGLGGTQRVYDGTTAAALTGTATSTNTIAGDNLTISGAVTAGTYLDKNAGVGKAFASVNTTGLTLGGTDAANYSVSLGKTNAVGTVTPLDLIVSGLIGATRTYDGSTVIAVSGTPTASNLVAGDVLSFTGSVTGGNFSDKNVASGKAITLNTSTLGLTGADAGNYTLALGKTTATGAVTPLQVVLGGLAGTQRVYDSTTAAAITGTAVSTNTLAGDNLIISGAVTSGTYVDKNVGVNKAFASVNTAGLSLSGTDAINYTVSAGQTNAVGTVTPKELIIGGLTGSTRVYDGTTSIAVSGTATASNAFAGDVVGFAGAATTGVLNNKNVGTNKAITLSAGSGLTLTGTDAANYSIVTGTTTATGNVTPLTLLYSGVTAADKVYDGTTLATLNGTLAPANVVAGDAVTLSNAGTITGSFDNRNVGFNKTVALNAGNLSLSGADAGNYAIGTVLVGVTANITKRTVTVGGVTVADRVYDATNVATFSGTATVANAIANDNVSLANFAPNTGLFSDKNVAINKAVSLDISKVSLAGADAGNYDLVASTGLTASITPATLSLAGVSFKDKVYDGTTAATIVGTPTLAGILAGDAVGYTLPPTAGTFVSKNAGSNVAINISLAGSTLSGADAGNYVIESAPTGYKANITKAPLVALGKAEDKIFDFTTTATVTALSYSGLVNGESLAAVDLSGLTGDFIQAKPGKNLRVDITGFTPADGPNGALASNYELVSPTATATASILTFKDLGPAQLAKLLSKMPKDKVVSDGGATNLTNKQDRPVYLAEKDKPWNNSFATYELNLDAISDYITVRKVAPITRTYQEALPEFQQSPGTPQNQVRLQGNGCQDANALSYACRAAELPAWAPQGAIGSELLGDPLTLKLAPVKLISRGDEWIVSMK